VTASGIIGNASGRPLIRAVEPQAFSTDAEGRISVSVHAIVRDLTGKVLSDQTVEHVYEMHDGLVRRMEIR
jgi:hypothetical protein